jgi:hypothetical protein
VTERGTWSTWDVIYDALKAVNSILPENFACKGKSLKEVTLPGMDKVFKLLI